MPNLLESINDCVFCESRAYPLYLLLFNHWKLDPLDVNTRFILWNKTQGQNLDMYTSSRIVALVTTQNIYKLKKFKNLTLVGKKYLRKARDASPFPTLANFNSFSK